MLVELIKIGYLSLAVGAISLTISKSKVFKGLREDIGRKSSWAGGLIECPYCTSHWVSFLVAGAYLPRPFPTYKVVDWFISSMAMVTLASFISSGIFRAISSIAEKHDEPESEETGTVESGN